MGATGGERFSATEMESPLASRELQSNTKQTQLSLQALSYKTFSTEESQIGSTRLQYPFCMQILSSFYISALLLWRSNIHKRQRSTVIIWVKPLASRMLSNIWVLQNDADYWLTCDDWRLGEDQTLSVWVTSGSLNTLRWLLNDPGFQVMVGADMY